MVIEMFNRSKLIGILPFLEGKFYYAETMVSTNDRAAELVREGYGSGTLVFAESQTKGRGRGEKSWSCPAAEGLLFSLVLEPDIPREQWSRLALAAGLAVSDAIQSLGVDAAVKWPNDVWIGEKKCAGILIEGCDDYLIVGIGMNVSVLNFPEGVRATSLKMEGVENPDREELLVEVIQNLMSWCSRCGEGFIDVVKAVNAKATFLNEMIQLEYHGETVQGVFRGVNADGHLLLEREEGMQVIAQADQIRRYETS